MATDRGCLLVKLHHSVVGLPDRLLVHPDGSVAFLEFKRPGQKPTKIQAYWHKRLRGMGQRVEVVYTAARFYRLLTTAT